MRSDFYLEDEKVAGEIEFDEIALSNISGWFTGKQRGVCSPELCECCQDCEPHYSLSGKSR